MVASTPGTSFGVQQQNQAEEEMAALPAVLLQRAIKDVVQN